MKEKEYISALVLASFFTMTALGLASSSSAQFIHLVPYVFIVSAIVIIGNNKYQNFDHYFFYGLIFLLSFIIHLLLSLFDISVLRPSYSSSLGLNLMGVPLIIPVIWIIVINSVNGILRKFNLNAVISSFIGAILVLILDIFLETEAVKFGFWSWDGDIVPMANYFWWFSLSFGFLLFSFKLDIRNNTFIGVTTYILLLLFLVATDTISF